MAYQLDESKRSNQIYELDSIRYLREEDAADIFGLPYSSVLYFAQAAGAVYQLPKITLIHRKKMEKYMNHLHKVPNTGKYVQKKFVRIGEGSITYSIGHHRFIEMARAAGAVYKINEGTGGTVLVNLEIFDEYMEQFREEPREMKNPLWKPKDENWKRK